METTACQPKVSRPLHLPRCSIRHGWLFSMSCQSRVRPGFTAVITIVGIYTTAPLFQTRRLVAGRQAAETLAAGHGCTGRRPPSLMMQQQTLPLLLPRQTDREREKGPWTEQPHGLTSNNLPPTRPPAWLRLSPTPPSTSSCSFATTARLKLSRSQSSKGAGRWGWKERRQSDR